MEDPGLGPHPAHMFCVATVGGRWADPTDPGTPILVTISRKVPSRSSTKLVFSNKERFC